MSSILKILVYQMRDLARSKWIVIYTLFFLVLTEGLFQLGGSSEKVILSLVNIVLLVIPLMSLIFGVLYLYHSRDVIHLILSQPIDRGHLFTGLSFGLAIPLALGYVMGVGGPFLWHGLAIDITVITLLLLIGVILTFVFTFLAFYISLHNEDRARGFGIAVFCWLFFALLYDGLILFIAFTWSSYPLEKPMIALSILNPIDLGRILILLKLDFSALMGYTGAVFSKYFGSLMGTLFSLTALGFWLIMPFWIGRRSFLRKDL